MKTETSDYWLTGNGNQTPNLLHRATNAFRLGMGVMLRVREVNVDVVWALKKITALLPNNDVDQYIIEQTKKLWNNPAICLISQVGNRLELPVEPGNGLDKFRSYVGASYGQPKERAICFITDYLQEETFGYSQTHQFLVMLWAEETGLKLPQDILDKKEEILQRICKEQEKAELFDDLYVERAALLMLWGNPKSKDVEQWIDLIINHQQNDGLWKKGSFSVSFDGDTAIFDTPATHTSAHSLLALSAYIK